MTKHFKVMNDDTGYRKAELWIYDAIGESMWFDSVSAQDVRRELKSMGDVDEINVRINSEGGDVFDGVAIFNLLRDHRPDVIVNVDGVAASIASVVAMAGDAVVMGTSSFMMIHDPWAQTAGNAAELRATAEILERVGEEIISAYQVRSPLDREQLRQMMHDETWMGPSDAQTFGFADDVLETNIAARVRDSWKRNYRNAPKSGTVKCPVLAKTHQSSDAPSPLSLRLEEVNKINERVRYLKAKKEFDRIWHELRN